MVDLKPSILIQGLQVEANAVASVAMVWRDRLCCWLLGRLMYLLSNRIDPAQSRLVASTCAVPAAQRGGAA